MTGATLSLLLAFLYLWLGVPGLVLGVPPLFLIWYSYDVYAGRLRDRATFSSEVASFREEIASAVRSQDELRDAQRRVAAEIERARGIQADLLPRQAPDVPGLELAHRIEFMTEMGGDYFDFVPLSDGRLGLVCGDVMGKGLAAALIMTMARSLILSAARDGHRPGEVLSRGQRRPDPRPRRAVGAVVSDARLRDLLAGRPRAGRGQRRPQPAARLRLRRPARVPLAGQHARRARRSRVPRGPARARARRHLRAVHRRPHRGARRRAARCSARRGWRRRSRAPRAVGRRDARDRPGRPWPIFAAARRSQTTPPCCSGTSWPSRITRIGRYRK